MIRKTYFLPVRIRQTAATAPTATVWGMRATVGGKAYIERIHLCTFFDQASAAAIIDYRVARFAGATFTGGTALTVIEAVNDLPASTIGDARFLDTGLTTGVATFEQEFMSCSGSGSQGGQVYEWHVNPHVPFLLLNGDGLCIRLHSTATIGQGIAGYVQWTEQ